MDKLKFHLSSCKRHLCKLIYNLTQLCGIGFKKFSSRGHIVEEIAYSNICTLGRRDLCFGFYRALRDEEFCCRLILLSAGNHCNLRTGCY